MTASTPAGRGNHCATLTRSWRTDDGAPRRWHHTLECASCNGTGIYSANAACSCGHFADDCPDVRVEAPAEPPNPKLRFRQTTLFDLEASDV